MKEFGAVVFSFSPRMRFDRKTFWTKYKAAFGARVSQKVVDAIEFLLDGFEQSSTRWTSVKHVAYALSTIKHETANTFLPITEYGGKAYFNKYNGRRDLGNNQPGDGYRFRGRGFVQITGRTNYEKYGIAAQPELALEPITAFRILTTGMHNGMFTGKKLADYINAKTTDYKNARRIINGTDKAALIAGYAVQFEKILKDSAAVPATQNQPNGIKEGAVEHNEQPDGIPATDPSPINQPTQAEGQTIVDVPQADPAVAKEPGLIDKARAWMAALPAFVTAGAAGVWSWIQGAATEIIIAFFATAAVIATVWIVTNTLSRNKREARETELKLQREQHAFEITKLQMQSAMNPNLQTVRVVPTPIANSDSPEVGG